MQPKVSVIIPVYSVEKYIARCVRSLFEQTLDDIEYIFVDDCSPDNSIQILKQLIKEYPNREDQIRIVRMQTNSGQAAVRKCGCKLATGMYIIHCDSDDWVDADMYEVLYNEAVKGNHDIVICDYFLSKSKEDNVYVNQDIDLQPTKLMHKILSESVHSALWNKLVRADIYENDIMYPQYNLREDLALTCQLLYHSKSIGYVKHPYYHYFLNAESITNKRLSVEQSVSRAMQSIHNCKLMDNFLIRKGVISEYKADMICMKLRLKNGIACMTNTKEGKKQWRSLFPELSGNEIVRSEASLKAKLTYLLVYIGFYPILKILLDKLR